MWTPDGGYTDPLASVAGPEAISEFIGGAQQRFAGLAFHLVDNVDAHHNLVRFGWRLVPTGATESVVDGFDVLDLDDNGQIRQVYGFLDKVPAA